MSQSVAEQRAWVERVLGLQLPPDGKGGALAERWRAACAAWFSASDAVDAQLAQLAAALQSNGDAALLEIAKTGLGEMSDSYKTRMKAALKELGDDDPARLRKSAAKAAGLIEKLQEQIESDERVGACDTNELGTSVAIRATLRPALQGIVAVLNDAGRPAAS